MACSMMNEKIRMHVETGDRDVNVMLGQDTENKEKNLSTSALQNSEVNRMNLSSMLRKAKRKSNTVPPSESWSNFFSRTRGACANANGAE